MAMKVVQYKCSGSRCGATDKMRLFPSEPVPMAINCWKCHAGFQIPLPDMLARKIGMFPVGSPEITTDDEHQAIDVSSTEQQPSDSAPAPA